ncbi:glycosyltransferase [Photobacterium sp. SP02]|uniref:glycosyltransferase n=1 Tax=Photobacterium sp. SP02 TaxID=3032280 RepID=UPI00314563A5
MFSVVITTKDRPQFLQRVLASIEYSTVLPDEVIIVNDGEKISDTVGGFLFSIQVFNNEKPMGANFSRNFGINHSKSDIVFLIDDDDAFSKTAFEDRLNIFESDPDVGLCFTGIKIVNSSNLNEVIRTVTPLSCDDYHKELFFKGNIIGSTSRVAIKKSDFIKAGCFDENLNCFQDYDLWIRMSKITKIKHDSKSNIYYTIHDSSNQISSNYIKYKNAAQYLLVKYNESPPKFINRLSANLNLRIAISAIGKNWRVSKLCSIKSFLKKPSLKSFVITVLPGSVIKKLYSFV